MNGTNQDSGDGEASLSRLLADIREDKKREQLEEAEMMRLLRSMDDNNHNVDEDDQDNFSGATASCLSAGYNGEGLDLASAIASMKDAMEEEEEEMMRQINGYKTNRMSDSDNKSICRISRAERANQIKEKKKEAVMLKRAGKITEAKNLLREIKTMQSELDFDHDRETAEISKDCEASISNSFLSEHQDQLEDTDALIHSAGMDLTGVDIGGQMQLLMASLTNAAAKLELETEEEEGESEDPELLRQFNDIQSNLQNRDASSLVHETSNANSESDKDLSIEERIITLKRHAVMEKRKGNLPEARKLLRQANELQLEKT